MSSAQSHANKPQNLKKMAKRAVKRPTDGISTCYAKAVRCPRTFPTGAEATTAVILPNSPAASTISQAELEKRTNSFNARRAMLRSNPSLYVSKTRLSIRQIPLFVTERVLKRLAMHSVRTFNAEVKQGIREDLSPDERACPVDQEEPEPKKRGGVQQAKVVRQADRVDAVTGKGRSRGYGFIEMHTHADALRVLRWANNNPGVIALCDGWWREELAECVTRTDEARAKRMREEMVGPARDTRGALIVEFSIENVQVVKRRAAIRVRWLFLGSI